MGGERVMIYANIILVVDVGGERDTVQYLNLFDDMSDIMTYRNYDTSVLGYRVSIITREQAVKTYGERHVLEQERILKARKKIEACDTSNNKMSV